MKRMVSTFVVTVLLTGVPNWVWAQSIAMPCIASTDPQVIQAQKKAGSDHAGERTCADVLSQYMPEFEKRIQVQADNWYRGCDLNTAPDPSESNPALPQVPKFTLSDGSTCRGTHVAGPVCNLLSNGVPATYNHGVEDTQNHNGGSCGDWPNFRVKPNSHSCVIIPDYTGLTKLIEDSYNRGAFVQSLNCYHHQVSNELTQHSIQIADNSPCHKMGQTFSQISGDTRALAAKMKQDFGNEANLSDVDYCKGTEKVSATDPGRFRQSACQLSAARAAREAMFFQLASCEVFARAKTSFEKFLAGTPHENGISQAVLKSYQGTPGTLRQCSAAVVTDHYSNAYKQIFTQKAKKLWNAKSCQ